jgi:hypothetical protein
MVQNWGLGPFGSQVVNPFSSTFASAPQALQLLQVVPQQLQQLQQLEYAQQQQLQQIQQLVQYVASQLQYLAQHQTQQSSLGVLGPQGFGQPFPAIAAGIPSAFSTPPFHVM